MPARRRLGICQPSCNAPPITTPAAIDTIIPCGQRLPTVSPSASPLATEPMLKNVEASAGTPNRPRAFKIAIASAASATSNRKGNMMRVSSTVNSNLPGTRANPGASSRTNCGLKTNPSTQTAPAASVRAVATTCASSAASSAVPVASASAKVGTKAEASAPSANRFRVRLGMRKPVRNAS